MDRGVWPAIVHGITESDTTQQLNNNKIKLSNMSVTSHSSPIFVCGEAP